MRAVVVIPVYEPEECLKRLVEENVQSGQKVVLVDDGSAAGYAPVFEELSGQAEVLHHRKNLGKGAAIRTALAWIQAHEQDYDVVGIMDGDGQHLTEDMGHLLWEADRNPGSLILGVRSVGKKMPLRSRFGNLLTRTVFHMLSGTRISDTQSGLRAFSVKWIPRFLEVQGDRYEYETNQLLCCVEEGITVKEIPVQTVYKDQENSTSHFRVLRDSIRIYGEFFKFAGSSLAGFAVDYVLFGLLVFLLPDGRMELLTANFAARVVSASFNYCLNSRLVFRQKETVSSALSYLALAGSIFVLNSLFLSFYTEIVGLPNMAAKLFTEISLFVISFLVQKKMIFGKKKKSSKGMEFVL